METETEAMEIEMTPLQYLERVIGKNLNMRLNQHAAALRKETLNFILANVSSYSVLRIHRSGPELTLDHRTEWSLMDGKRWGIVQSTGHSS